MTHGSIHFFNSESAALNFKQEWERLGWSVSWVDYSDDHRQWFVVIG